MKDPDWREVDDYFEFDFKNEKILVYNVDVYWTTKEELIDILKRKSRLLFIDGAYSTVGNGIVVLNNGKINNIIQIQVHAY